MNDNPMRIPIAGPSRSGTDGDPRAMAAGLAHRDVTEIPRRTPQETT
ncbi:hypothetical protein ACIOHE_25200 [Streptomyces sp. NPDC087851]